ncbi:hypothetical protein LXL04_012975 [Taraxacum kok-saghyz]
MEHDLSGLAAIQTGKLTEPQSAGCILAELLAGKPIMPDDEDENEDDDDDDDDDHHHVDVNEGNHHVSSYSYGDAEGLRSNNSQIFNNGVLLEFPDPFLESLLQT